MLHLRRYFAALAVLLTLFGTYALAVAPWVAPPPIAKRPDDAPAGTSLPVTQAVEEELARLFPPDAWERNGATIIETEQCTLLIRDYDPTPDGKLVLKPCTLILHAGSQAARRPIVMQAPQGAVLTFDRAIDLGRAQVGKLLEGELDGPIRIFSPPTKPGGGDALELTTSEVKLKDNSVYTWKDVAFRYGESVGRGDHLVIHLVPKSDEAQPKGKTSFGGVQSLEFEHIRELRIATAGGDLFGKGDKGEAKQGAAGGVIEVSCQGAFKFDMLGQVAQFDDNVEVRRVIPGLAPDRILCDSLYLGFGKPVAAAASDAGDPLAGRLQKITAVGGPAVLEAPASGVQAAAAIMEYSLAERRITLQPDSETKRGKQVTHVALRQHGQHFTARELHYEMGEPDRLGRLWAAGPGELRLLQGRGANQQTVVARWEKELRVQPQEQYQVISLVNAASVTVDPLGRFDADELHFWVQEVSGEPVAGEEEGGKRTTVLPHRLKATGGVKLTSTQLDADTSELHAWFINMPPDPAALPPGAPGMGQPVREPVARMGYEHAGLPGAGLLPAGGGGAIGEFAPQGAIRDVVRAPSLQKFHVGGGLIQMQLVVKGRKFELDDLTIKGHAAIDETRTPEPGQEPLRIAGEQIEVRHGTKASEATCQVSGTPAEVGGRGVSMRGNVVQVHRGQNRMWIDGPGDALLPAPSEQSLLPGVAGTSPPMPVDARQPPQPAAPPQKMHLVWQQRFNFDGLTASFVGDIVARTPTQTAHAPLLEAHLAQRMDFAATGGQPQPELALVKLDGLDRGVYLNNRGLDEQGRQISYEQMQAKNLTVDRQRGTLHADGPGWVSTVRRAGSLAAPGAANGQAALPGAGLPGAALPLEEQPLSSVHITFDRAIDGNLAKREIVFHDRVRTTYSPARDFTDRIEAKAPGDLSEKGMLMTSDRLILTEVIMGGQRWIEVQATDRVLAESQNITAEAASIRYTSDKEILTIEGSARAPFHVWHRKAPGEKPTTITGNKIHYHLRTNQVDLESINHIDLQDIGGAIKLPGLGR